MPEKHSKLGASSMYRWEACPASVRFCETIPPAPSSAAADDGTLAHDQAARILLGENPFEVVADTNRLEHIMVYVDTVMDDYTGRAIFPTTNPSKREHLGIEHRFDLSSIYPKCFGTCDAWVWEERTRLLRIYDFKFGAGHHVDAEDNSQLLYYALGAIVTLGFPVSQVECVIVQPRSKRKTAKVRRWRFSAVDMIDFEDRLIKACERTEDPNAPFVLGRHCWFCPGRTSIPRCPAYHAQALEEAKEEFTVVEDDSGIY